MTKFEVHFMNSHEGSGGFLTHLFIYKKMVFKPEVGSAPRLVIHRFTRILRTEHQKRREGGFGSSGVE